MKYREFYTEHYFAFAFVLKDLQMEYWLNPKEGDKKKKVISPGKSFA